MFKDGVIKIVDFGFSSHLDSKSQLVSSMAGKFFYAAPECFTGDKYSPHQADIFSFGCVMYFLATGEDTFEGKALHALS